jgi:hypothetical protein
MKEHELPWTKQTDGPQIWLEIKRNWSVELPEKWSKDPKFYMELQCIIDQQRGKSLQSEYVVKLLMSAVNFIRTFQSLL